MNNGVKFTAVPSAEELQASPGYPSRERMERGAVACIECVQDIPCNPCEAACPFGAITVGEPITNLPALDEERCTGCGLCIAQCPGLAIFVVHKNYTDSTALVTFPYEYHPLPEEGQEVSCAGRAGEFVTPGRVKSVKLLKKYDRTPLVAVEIAKEYCDSVRTVCPKEKRQDAGN